jgi:hypothetical protein
VTEAVHARLEAGEDPVIVRAASTAGVEEP